MAENPELLFFDTFSHGTTQELNLDLVQFTNPVYVTEIRIIPLGARVQADFPGGVRLGATNPSEFSVEFFVNDLSTQGISTFQNLGVLEYNQNGPIHHVCENKQIPTDGLILRGWYTTVTLAVYGFITKTRPTQLTLVSQNTPPAVETSTPRVISEHKTAEWVQQHAQVYHKEAVPEYDVKDISLEESNTSWALEKDEEKTARWEKQEIKEEAKEEQKPPVNKPKRSPEPAKQAKRRSSADESTDRTSEHHDHKKYDEKKYDDKKYNDKKVKPKRSRRSPSRSRSSSKTESKKKARHEEPEPEFVIKLEKREKTPEPVSPKVSLKETPAAATFSTPSLAPEDVELISEEEISEAENSPRSPAHTNATVMDKVNDVSANKTLATCAQEDSLDMDQFEPILSGSSDIESEEEIDLQDVEFDSNDLVDEPSKIFNPFLFDVQPLLSMKSPCITDYEWDLMQRKIFDHSSTPLNGEQIDKFKTLLLNVQLKLDDEISEEWVTYVETLTPLVKSSLVFIHDKSNALSVLMNSVNIGVDFDKAYNQSKPLFKVRHLKAGIRLAEVLCRCSETIAFELIKVTNLHHKLLDLYEKEHIALSIKLAILKSLNISLNYGKCVEQFINNNVDSAQNGYQRLIKVFRSTRLARVRYSMTNIFRKLHLYEILENIYAITTVNSVQKSNRLSVEDIENLSMFLEETLRYLREAPVLICQPVRLLPVCSRFEFPINVSESCFAVYSYFQHFHFLDLISTVVTIPEFIAHPGVVSCILETLAELMDTEEGMLYLVHQHNATNRILKMLSSSPEDQYSISPQLGLHMAHSLYVLNLADGFQHKWRAEQAIDIDNTQLLETLSSLYHLTFTILGKHAVTHVLSRGDLIKPILKALQCSRSSGRERRKSPGKAFIMDLMWMVIRSSDNVSFLKRHRSDLIEVGSWQSDSNNSSWLNPIRNESCFSYNDVTDLCDYLKKHTEKAILYPGELITAVRILRHLALPYPKYYDEEECTELKYKFVLIQLFSQEGLTYLTSILHKICNHYERPCLHTYTLAGKEGSAMISLVLPAIQLIRALVEYVVRCRDVEFKDLTAVLALLKTYCLMFYVTQTSLIHLEAVETMKEIVETLLLYTQTVAIEPLNDSKSLNKSVWTLMMSEVFKYAISLPETFLPCSCLISELLPLPFPIQTKTPLTESEVILANNSRKLWSAHLLPLNGPLQEFLVTLCYSSNQPLLQVLKRVCVQLADLGPPTALTVSRSVLTSLWKEISGGESLNSRAVRLLNVLACLLNHSALKMSIIQITTATGKGEELFAEFWTTVLTYLTLVVPDNIYHVQGQECILSMIQGLCDIEVSLYPPPSPNVSVETYLSNSLPPKNLFRTLCEAVVKHIENQTNAFSSIAAALRTCITLTEYDYGMYRLKICLSEYPNTLYNVAQKLVQEWSKENTDCLSCLSSLLDLLKECASREIPAQENGVNLRTLSINDVELAKLLKWNHQGGAEVKSNDEKNVLEQLESLLTESSVVANDDDIFQSIRANLTSLIHMLNDAQNSDSLENAAIELILDLPEPLLTQFQSRPVFVLGDVDDERLSVAYWLSVLPLDDIDQDAEQVVGNLEEVVNSFIPNLNLETELEKLGHREAGHHDLMKKDSTEVSEDSKYKPVPAVLAIKPAKPRTFIRPIPGPHRNDAFRSRIPNSSRAPSLHVDDFIALEKHNQQAASTGYNRITGKHQISDISGNTRNRLHSFLQDRTSAAAAVHFHSSFRPTRGVLNSWHPLLSAKPSGRTIVKNQPTVIHHPTGAPLMIRGADLLRFSLSLRWPPPVRPGPPPQLRHHPPPHASIHRHLRPPPPAFPPL